MNYISYSLFGDNPLYLVGAVENARIVKNELSDWKAIFYLGPQIDKEVVEDLIRFGAILKFHDKTWHNNGSFWRFYAMYEPEAELVITRDVDSRISQREINALKDWVNSTLPFHIMRDHPHHNESILAGMFGADAKQFCQLASINDMFSFGDGKYSDQEFLKQAIYPFIKRAALIHDSFFRREARSFLFPTRRIDGEFVGEVINEFGEIDTYARRILLKVESSIIQKMILKSRDWLSQIKVQYLKSKQQS